MLIEPLPSFTWPTDGVPLAALAVRVDAVAVRLGVAVAAWCEDGLGPAHGFGYRLPSGRLCFLEELELAIQYQGERGPTLYVDAADLGSIGPESMLAEVRSALGLAESEIARCVGIDAQQAATEWAANVAHAKRR